MKLNRKQIKAKLDAILAKYDRDNSMLVSILQDTQAEFGYLPREVLVELSEMMCVPLTQIYSVATFFKAFSLVPRGKHMIHVCLGTACHVRGAERVLDSIERELCIKPGENSEDLNFALETVNCVGACALGPIVIVDGTYKGDMKTELVKPLLESYK